MPPTPGSGPGAILKRPIPSTSKLAYMIDNASAGMGDIPPPSFWAQGAHRIDI